MRKLFFSKHSITHATQVDTFSVQVTLLRMLVAAYDFSADRGGGDDEYVLEMLGGSMIKV